MVVKPQDRKKYLLKEDRDFQILEKIYQLEKYKLSSEDVRVVKLIRTQLEDDWRKPLIQFLDKLAKKYE